MTKLLYTVRTTLPTAQLHARFLAWLVPDHIAAVKAGGAETVRVILPDRAKDVLSSIIETQYAFPSRQVFETYLREYAPALRADNQKHFPPETGVTSERQIAEIAAELK